MSFLKPFDCLLIYCLVYGVFVSFIAFKFNYSNSVFDVHIMSNYFCPTTSFKGDSSNIV